MAIQTVAVVETERLQRAGQGYYRTRRRVRQAEILDHDDLHLRPPARRPGRPWGTACWTDALPRVASLRSQPTTRPAQQSGGNSVCAYLQQDLTHYGRLKDPSCAVQFRAS